MPFLSYKMRYYFDNRELLVETNHKTLVTTAINFENELDFTIKYNVMTAMMI